MALPKTNQPRLGLEPWLVRTIEHGHLSGLPAPYPNVGGSAQRADAFARNLLSRLHSLDPHSREYDRARDDGRAFRSWVEAFCPPFDGASAASPVVRRV